MDWNKWCHSSLWGHHYAIWASDSNFLLAPKNLFGPAKGWPSFQALQLLQHNICYPHNLFFVLWNLMISWIVFILHRKIFPIHHTYIYSLVSYLFIKQDQLILTLLLHIEKSINQCCCFFIEEKQDIKVHLETYYDIYCCQK